MSAEPLKVDPKDLPPITAAGLQRHREKLLALMDKVSPTMGQEDFKVVQEELRKFYGMIYVASRLPREHWFEIDTRRYFFDFQQTPEHVKFDRVRTYLYHQTPAYKAYKAKDNKQRYEEQLRAERSTPEALARSAAMARRRRRRDAYESVQEDLHNAFVKNPDAPRVLELWAAAEAAYAAVVAIEVPRFYGDGYGEPWADVKRVLVKKWTEVAKKVTSIHRKAEKAKPLDAAVSVPDPAERSIEEILAENDLDGEYKPSDD